jgi:hypothetical protein
LGVFALRCRGWDGLLRYCRGHQNKLWRVTRLIKNRRRACPLKLEGTVFVKNQEMAVLVAETFSNVYHTQKYGLNSVIEQTVASSVESFRLAEVELVPKFLTSPTEVRNAVRELHLTGATELDLIDNKLLRHLPRKAIVYLTHLFHACLKLSYFPILQAR